MPPCVVAQTQATLVDTSVVETASNGQRTRSPKTALDCKELLNSMLAAVPGATSKIALKPSTRLASLSGSSLILGR